MPQPRQQQQQPQVGSIERGTVQRIEAYGAFVALERYRLRGLIHISQLANCKVEKVDDCVSLNDIIYVKILEVDRDDQGRPKIRLSLRDASQDGTCQDLGQERDQHVALSQQIQQELQSTIGMGVALDPMAKTNLILKSANRSATIINGYALVDDTEGEAPRAPVAAAPVPAMASMGRGRGTTLPAWMTHQLDGPIKVNASDHDPGPTATSSSSKHSKKEKKSKRTVERKHRKRDKEYSSDEENYRHRRKHHRRRNDDDDDDDDHDDSSRERRSKRRRENSKKSSSRRSRRSQSSDDSDSGEFQNVEQAKRLIAELEAKKATMNP